MNIGFLTVLHEPTGYLGGYLVTNQWGRPLEFRLSTAVQPNRIQHILYSGTLQPYICADLIGKTLVDKTGTSVQLILTDTAAALDLRLRLENPVAWVRPAGQGPGNLTPVQSSCVCTPTGSRDTVLCHPQFLGDIPLIRQFLERLDGTLELAEPFARIREAIGEARKMGVTQRMAG
jgi:hypothetical protein